MCPYYLIQLPERRQHFSPDSRATFCMYIDEMRERRQVFALEQSLSGILLTSCTRLRILKEENACSSLALRVCSSALTLSIRPTFNINFHCFR